MPYKDPAMRKAYMKQYYQKNKEELTDRFKEWYCENRDEKLEYMRQYTINNQEKVREYRQTPAYKKIQTIHNWKRKGVKHDDFDALYELYLETTHCMVCKNAFLGTFDRCLDHDHSTGEYRQILCQDCNRHDRWKNKISTSS